MSSSQPTVTVGLPVCNGEKHLAEALEALLAQDYRNLEILISDNASTDATADICRRFAAADSRVRYMRNDRNIGMMQNFLRLPRLAQGRYFFWSAHDDRRNPSYVSRLVAAFDETPAAILAAPAVIYLDEAGKLLPAPVDRPPLAGQGLANLRRLYAEHSVGWYYGLWRTDWLRDHLSEVERWPLWGGDIIWLAAISLRDTLAGDDGAILYKRLQNSPLAPKTARAKVHFWLYMFWYLSEVSTRHGRGRAEKAAALALSWQYVYRACIRRPGTLRTIYRVLRLTALAGVTALPAWIYHRVVGRRRPAADATQTDGSSNDRLSRAA